MAEIVINFGKHKNAKLNEVPKDYLKWVYKENKDKEKLSPYMKKILEYIKMNVDIVEKPFNLSVIPFGKYKGQALEDIPIEYLQWIYKQNVDKDDNSKYMMALLEYIKNLE